MNTFLGEFLVGGPDSSSDNFLGPPQYFNISIKVWHLIGLEQDMLTSYWLTEAKLPQ